VKDKAVLVRLPQVCAHGGAALEKDLKAQTPINWRDLPPGEHRLTCPHCGRGKRDKTLGVTVDADGAGIAHCFRCEYVETYRPERPGLQSKPQRPPAHQARRVVAPQHQRHETLSDAGIALWKSTHAITPDSPAGRYLLARRCKLPPAGSHLRELPAHRHPSGHVGPWMVALLTDFETREPRSLHFTWLGEGGRKADVSPPRRLLPGHAKAGAVCRLWPDEYVSGGLGVAEGIETALSLAHGYEPVWAAIDAGNLSALPVLPGIESLLIACDRDPAGEKAAQACAQRWAAAGVRVGMTWQEVNDMNDLCAA